MAGETPGRGAVQTGGGEGVEAQFCAAGVDVVGHGLQSIEIGDVIQGVASLLQQSGVDDDAEGLVAVADGLQLAGVIVEVKGIGGQFSGNGGVGQIQGVLIPVFQTGHVADVEDGGSFRLGHLRGQGVGVGAGSGGNNLNRHTGGLGVQGSQLLQSGVCFRLEVQIIYGTGIGSLFA